MTTTNKKTPRVAWLLKDAWGMYNADYLIHEPTRHTASDFIPMIEKSAYDKAVATLKEIDTCPTLLGAMRIAERVLRELGEV